MKKAKIISRAEFNAFAVQCCRCCLSGKKVNVREVVEAKKKKIKEEKHKLCAFFSQIDDDDDDDFMKHI